VLPKYFLKRLLVAIPSLLIATVIVFSLVRLIPGDVVVLMMEENQYADDIEAMRAKLGLNRPIYLQYFQWVGRALRGDLGDSLYTRRPVVSELLARVPVSLELGAVAIFFAILLGIPVGILSAVRQDTAQDYAARGGAILGLSVPGFWLGTLVVVLPAIYFKWSPSIQFTKLADNPWGHVTQFILPGLLLGKEGEEDVDPQMAHHLGHPIDHPVVVLYEKNLESRVVVDSLTEVRGEVAVVEDQQRVMQHHRVERFQLQERGAADSLWVVRAYVVAGEAREGADVVEHGRRVAAVIVAQQQHRTPRTVAVAIGNGRAHDRGGILAEARPRGNNAQEC